MQSIYQYCPNDTLKSHLINKKLQLNNNTFFPTGFRHKLPHTPAVLLRHYLSTRRSSRTSLRPTAAMVLFRPHMLHLSGP